MTEHPERHRHYDAAMEAVHGPETEPMLETNDFSRFQTMVDIGGGNGSVLVAMLRRQPGLFGVLFDLPAVAERTRRALSGPELAGRIRIEGGDFFTAVPAGADGYLLRHVLHDWHDPEAIRILERCREALLPGGRVLVVESVLPEGDEPCFGKWLDLMMLLVAGRERTESGYRALFAAAGLELARVLPTGAEVSILEGVAA